jgi:tRNA threonylcarbamoyladenosine biosynthesis protein TsaE
MEIQIDKLEDLPMAAKEFLDAAMHRKVFAFDASMGAGKTTFILTLLKAMGIEDPEGSPTYSLVNSYQSPFYGEVHHFDLYRLNSELEAFDFGIEEMLYGGGYSFIEWPDKIANLLPENTIWVYIRTKDETQRSLTFEI